MQISQNSIFNRQKVSTAAASCEKPLKPRNLTLSDILSHPFSYYKYRTKSGIYTGLAISLDKRASTASPDKASLPPPTHSIKKTKKHSEKGPNSPSITTPVKKDYNRIKRYSKKIKQAEELAKTDGFAEFFSPYTPFRDSFLIIRKSELSTYQIQFEKKRESHSAFHKHTHERVSFRKDLPTANRKNFSKEEKTAFKEAQRDKDWINKAKGQISKSFIFALNKSNGMEMLVPSEICFTYKFYLGKGNNSKLIKQCLSSRWWWTQVEEDQKDSANLVWSQWKDKSFLEKLEKIEGESQIEQVKGLSVVSTIKYYDSQSKPKNVDISSLGYGLITRSSHFASLQTTQYLSKNVKVHNKLEHNFHLSNKKALFYNLKLYYQAIEKNVFDFIPLTFHVKNLEDPIFSELENSFKSFETDFERQGKKYANLWIVKPGENSNRGNGISICNTIDQIKQELKNIPVPSPGEHTFIIQKYLEDPFLINKRKFDIRCYALITCLNGSIQGYYYNEGYLRTSSKPFSLQTNNKFVHLTNDAIQKNCEDYGKFENGNKLSYTDFQRYLDLNHSSKVSFCDQIIPTIKEIIADTIKSVFFKIDPNKRGHTFELFGYDFLLDSDLKPWLLEVNTNPCLELSSTHLSRIIPSLIENTFRICLDPIYQEPVSYVKKFNSGIDLVENKFELVFNSNTTQKGIVEIINSNSLVEKEIILNFLHEEAQEDAQEDAQKETKYNNDN